jgi:hypothetical protein
LSRFLFGSLLEWIVVLLREAINSGADAANAENSGDGPRKSGVFPGKYQEKSLYVFVVPGGMLEAKR